MKAVVYYDTGDFRVEDVPIPRCGPEEVLVRVKACGVCSTDIFKAKYRRVKPGSVLGHEISGEVTDVGSGVNNLRVGDRIGVLHHAPCGSCHFCLSGQETLCEQYRQLGIDPGGFAEYIRVMPELVRKTVLKIPDDLSYEEATMIEPTACCIRGLSTCDLSAGDSLLIIGDGPMGLLHVQMAKYFGASQVILSGHHDFRLKTSKRLGADHALNSGKTNAEERVKELTEGRGVDVVVVAVASTAAVHEGIRSAREGGKICLFGDFRDVPQPKMEVNPDLMISHQKTLLGSWGCSPKDYQTAFKMIKTGRIRAKDLITHAFPIEKFTEALELTEKREECLKVVVKP